jgi:cardiolipin synthase A/B
LTTVLHAATPSTLRRDRVDPLTHALADQAFSRASGAPLVGGNAIRLLRDAAENFPAMLDAIRAAHGTVHLEMYIVHPDSAGRMFLEALTEAAHRGVRVRVLYDWWGGIQATIRRFWAPLEASGAEVRAFNPPSLLSPLGWVHRDHRKLLVADHRVAIVTGLCIGEEWLGDPERGVDPWRDTGVAVEGPAVADLDMAFADAWQAAGAPLPPHDVPLRDDLAARGDVGLRVIAGTSYSTAMFRVDTLIAALARKRLWLTDAYYAGTSTYVQALRAAAHDGVDVRLLLPGAGSDIAIMQMMSRAGYRTLLEAGVRIFEWNGPMIHAKTAVADGRWSRIGSTNLNIASWMSNWELDVIIEDRQVGEDMEAMYLEDLDRSTEIVLGGRRARRVVRSTPAARLPRPQRRRAGGVAAGALRVGKAVGAAISDTRMLGPEEARLPLASGALLFTLALLGAWKPSALALPIALLCGWIGLGLVASGLTSWVRARRAGRRAAQADAPGGHASQADDRHRPAS